MAQGDIKLVFGTEAALTITLNSLPESATWVTGRESTAVAATGATVLDELIGGIITTAASVTVGQVIEIWVWGQYEGTPAYPGGITGLDAALTPATPKNAYMQLVATITIDSTSSKAYYFGPSGIASYFGGILPPRWGVWVTQSSDQNLHTSGNAIYHQPVYQNVAPS